jgi:hypothetical protein
MGAVLGGGMGDPDVVGPGIGAGVGPGIGAGALPGEGVGDPDFVELMGL